MPISPIQLTPEMDSGTQASAINNNFRQIEAENRTKVIKDEEGDSRILLGRDPRGRYIFAITVPGKDVIAETDVD